MAHAEGLPTDGELVIQPAPDEAALNAVKNKKTGELVKDLGSADLFARDAASAELARRIESDPRRAVADSIQKLADVADAEASSRVRVLLAIQDAKERLAEYHNKLSEINTRIARIHAQIENWEKYQEDAEPGTREGHWVVEHSESIAVHISSLQGRLSDLKQRRAKLERGVDSGRI
jgi:hypothetical protein